MSTTEKDPAVEKVRPLNATQARALGKLVDNDYLALRNELEQFAEDEADAAEAAVRAEWAGRTDDTAFVAEGRELVRKYEDDRRDLIVRARDAGIRLDVPDVGNRYGDRNVTATVIGLDEAVRNARARVMRDRNAAVVSLERSRLDTQRKVLTATLTTDAEALLQSLPTAQEMMLAVQAKKAAAQIESV